MGRSVAAIVFGFLVMSVVVVAFERVESVLAGEAVSGLPSDPYVGLRLLVDLVAAGAGGFSTAWIANARPLWHAGVLAVVVALLGVTAAIVYLGQQPLIYVSVQIALVFPAVLLGGWLRWRGAGG